MSSSLRIGIACLTSGAAAAVQARATAVDPVIAEECQCHDIEIRKCKHAGVQYMYQIYLMHAAHCTFDVQVKDGVMSMTLNKLNHRRLTSSLCVWCGIIDCPLD